jgi:hypothetical protein
MIPFDFSCTSHECKIPVEIVYETSYIRLWERNLLVTKVLSITPLDSDKPFLFSRSLDIKLISDTRSKLKNNPDFHPLSLLLHKKLAPSRFWKEPLQGTISSET